MKILETQLAQVASKDNQTPPSSLPSQEENVKSVYAVTTRSGRSFEDAPIRVESAKGKEVFDEDGELALRGESSSGEKGLRDEEREEERLRREKCEEERCERERLEKERVEIEKKEKERLEKEKKDKEKEPIPLNRQPREERLPFPQRVVPLKLNIQFAKFIEMIRDIYVSIPLVDVMKQMPHYTKFMKEVLSGKRDPETVNLTEQCSALVSNEYPLKLKDPGSFSIPCSIHGFEFKSALCDLGASVSIMPFSVFKKLNLGPLRPTNTTIQLANRSIMFPKGCIEDVPLKVGDFSFLVDFIVLDIAEDDRIPIILGRPFLATLGALIDVREGKLTLCVGDQKASFRLQSMMHSPSTKHDAMFVNSLPIINDCCMHACTSNNSFVAHDVGMSKDEGKRVDEKRKEQDKVDDDDVVMPEWFVLSMEEQECPPHVEVMGIPPMKRRNRKRKRKRKNNKNKTPRPVMALVYSPPCGYGPQKHFSTTVEGSYGITAQWRRVVFFDPP